MIRPDYREIKHSNELYHYGIPRRSGRYPWGSGKKPYQDDEKSLVKSKNMDDEKNEKEDEQRKVLLEDLNNAITNMEFARLQIDRADEYKRKMTESGKTNDVVKAMFETSKNNYIKDEEKYIKIYESTLEKIEGQKQGLDGLRFRVVKKDLKFADNVVSWYGREIITKEEYEKDPRVIKKREAEEQMFKREHPIRYLKLKRLQKRRAEAKRTY